MKELAYLNKYFGKYKWHLLLGILFVTINNIAGVYPPRLIGFAFDLVKENIAYYQLLDGFDAQSAYYTYFSYGLLIFGALVLILALIKGIFMFFMRQTLIVMSRLIEYDLKNEVYVHYQKLSMAFYKRNQTGDLMSRVTEDVSRVRMYFGPALMYGINLTILLTMVIIAMMSVNVKLALLVLSPLPILSISIFYVNSIINRKSEKIQEQLSNLTSAAQESYSGIRVLKSYVQEDSVGQFFSEESENYKQKSLDLAKVQALFFPLMIALVGISTIITIYVGGQQVINGAISAGNIAEFVIYVGMLTWPVASIGWVASIIQRAAASQKRINEFLKTEPDIVNPSDEPILLTGDIQFKNVSFTYPDTGIEALKNLTFSIKPHEKVAIVGRTGSGKSTIASLLERLYNVSEGEILLNGKNINTLNLKDIRHQIGYVPQDVFMFSDTVANNIAFGDKDMEESKILDAAKMADVHKDVEKLPQKYQTYLGERGVNVSGGQKQRLSLARALIKDPEIILLDDCLSAVDSKTEKNILYNLDTFLKEKTAIIITHRISSLIDFDRIIVLEKGLLVEQGTHDSLLQQRGIYYDLYKKQEQEDKKMSV